MMRLAALVLLAPALMAPAPLTARALTARPTPERVPPDSVTAMVPNRVVLDIDAPVATTWAFVPGIRVRPGAERVVRVGPWDQPGGEFDLVTHDSSGRVVRHDRLAVLHVEPNVRFAAHITMLPPAPPMTILYNVELHADGSRTRMVMDAYATVRLPRRESADAQRATWLEEQRSSEAATTTAYERLKREIEATARQR